jgi:soluble lytic murein transglycosylase-like protein
MKPALVLPALAVVTALLGSAPADVKAAAQGGEAALPAANDNPAEKARPPLTAETICLTLARTALENDLPIDFFTRLIWRESQFNVSAVSYAGAQGIAQFMPATATDRGLDDAFDPIKALHASGQFLKQLRAQFGNLGLAAAAYNAGPGRVQAWLAHRAALPRETRIYVFVITTIPAEKWIGIADQPEHRLGRTISCDAVAKLLLRTNRQRRQQPTRSQGR